MRLFLGLLGAIAAVAAIGCNSGSTPTAPGTPTAKSSPKGSGKLTKLGVEDTKVGTGEPVKNGDEVWILYTGKLLDGKVFDASSKHGNEPYHVTVGQGGVIRGWDLGLIGMKLHGKRKLSIPSDLGYRDQGSGEIPPNSDLYFDLELTAVLKGDEADTYVATDVKKGTGRGVKDGDTITISYVATANGVEFDSTKKQGKPLVLKVGTDQLQIPSFDSTLIGMQVGGERKVTIPPNFLHQLHNEALGANFATFDVKLLSLK